MAEECVFCKLGLRAPWSDAFKAGWRRLGNGEQEVIACPQHKELLAVKM